MKDANPKAYIYTRVSTEMQVDGYSLSAQTEDIKKFAEFRHIQIVGEYCDEGRSGKETAGRDDFNRMIDDIRNNKDGVKYVLVFKLSRFARNAADTLNNLKIIQEHGADLISVKDGLDSSSSTGKMMISIMSAFAEMELENIHVQTMAGRKQKAKEGKWNGGFAPYGYVLKDGKLEIVPEEAETVRYIFELYTTTALGAGGVAKRLNAEGVKKVIRQNGKHSSFTAEFVKKILDSEVFMGKITYGKRTNVTKDGNTYAVKQQDTAKIIVSEGIHEAIVSEDTWNKAHEKRLKTALKKEKREKDHEYILSGIVRCPGCGKPMYGIASRKKRKDGSWYAVSYAYACRTKPEQNGTKCPFHRQYNCKEIDKEIEEILITAFMTESLKDQILEQMRSKTDVGELTKKLEQIKNNRRELLARQTKLEREQDALSASDKHYDRKYESISRRMEEVFDLLDEVENAMKEMEDKINSAEITLHSEQEAYRYLLLYGAMYSRLNKIQKKQMANTYIDSIELFPTKGTYGYIKRVNFSIPVNCNGQLSDSITIWDRYPMLNEKGVAIGKKLNLPTKEDIDEFLSYGDSEDGELVSISNEEIEEVKAKMNTTALHGPTKSAKKKTEEQFPPKEELDESVVLMTRV